MVQPVSNSSIPEFLILFVRIDRVSQRIFCHKNMNFTVIGLKVSGCVECKEQERARYKQ